MKILGILLICISFMLALSENRRTSGLFSKGFIVFPLQNSIDRLRRGSILKLTCIYTIAVIGVAFLWFDPVVNFWIIEILENERHLKIHLTRNEYYMELLTAKKIAIWLIGLTLAVFFFFVIAPSVAEYFNPKVFDSIEGQLMVMQSSGIVTFFLLIGIYVITKNLRD